MNWDIIWNISSKWTENCFYIFCGKSVIRALQFIWLIKQWTALRHSWCLEISRWFNYGKTILLNVLDTLKAERIWWAGCSKNSRKKIKKASESLSFLFDYTFVHYLSSPYPLSYLTFWVAFSNINSNVGRNPCRQAAVSAHLDYRERVRRWRVHGVYGQDQEWR